MIPAKRGAPLLERLMCRCIPEPNSGCWLWEGSQNGNGYGLAFLDGKTVIGAHRAMLIAHSVPVGADDVVRHRCDNPSCVNPEHLVVGTQAENLADMCAKGRHGKSYVLEPEVRQMIREKGFGFPAAGLAELFGVSVKTIRNIRKEPAL